LPSRGEGLAEGEENGVVFFLVTGASGVGKSTVRALLDAELAPKVVSVELAHVLPLRAAPTRVWRQQATEEAVRRAVELQVDGRHLLLSGDPVPAAEVVAAPSATLLNGVAVCLLDASPEGQTARLTARGDDPNVLHHHHAFAEWMRNAARDPRHMLEVITTESWDQMQWDRLDRLSSAWHVTTIDTSELTPAQVAKAVSSWYRGVIDGDIPTIQVPAP
jgi:broad-specificity NMP kinase